MNASDSMPLPPARNRAALPLALGMLALVVASFWTLGLDWSGFWSPSALATTQDFLSGFAPPELSSPFLYKTCIATLETLAMSALGTLLAVGAGLALALVGAGRFGAGPRALVRLVLNVMRSIPELVWATILLVAAGLGPFAGMLALALHTTGVLGRLFADSLENANLHAENTLRTNGAAALPAFIYSTLPLLLPQMMSYTLYRWENNIRAAAVLGVVGAGGLGGMLKFHLSLFQMPQAATVIIAMLLMVVLVDATSFGLRRALTR
jgi:phosphonate transport system permease protein